MSAGQTGGPHVLVEAGQRAGGVVAARHRGDLAGAEALLADFPNDDARTVGFLLVAELSLTLLAHTTGEPMDGLVRELSLNIANSFTVS